MSIVFEDEQGNPVFSPLRAAELSSAKEQARMYLSARVTDSEEVGGEEYPTLTPLKAAELAKEQKKYRSARAKCPCPACSRG